MNKLLVKFFKEQKALASKIEKCPILGDVTLGSIIYTVYFYL